VTTMNVVNAADMAKALLFFIETAPPLEKAKLGAFILGYAQGMTIQNETEEEDDDHSGRE